jgi:Zn-dependent metalloprotease
VRTLKRGVCLVMLGASLVLMPMSQAGSAPTARAAGDQQLIKELRQDARGDVVASRESATGKVGFIRATGGRSADLMPGVAANDRASAVAKTRAFLNDYAGLFGTRPVELVTDQVTKNRLGWNVSYTQRYRGVPVFGGTLRAQVDDAGDLTSVNGYVAPDLDLDVTPRLSAAEAGRAAVAEVKADPPGHEGHQADLTGVTAKNTRLSVYRTGVPRGDIGTSVLTYVVEVSNDANVRDMVFVDADSGKTLNRYSMIHDGLYRELYEGNTNRSNRVWAEDEAFPGDLNEEQQNLVEGTGESYWFFMNAFGQDSYDGLGATMTTVNNDPRINCPNANWNGITTNYCNGVTSDDVVAHEWGHAYTEYSWDGIYQWQPGALNESFSDVWGETVDLINGRQDEEEGDIDTPRPVGQCSTHSPAQPAFTINSPAAIAKDCDVAGAAFGPQLDDTGLTGDLVIGLDADEDADGDPNPFDLEGSTFDGCSPLTNAAEVAGKIVMLNRGLCGFEEKARTAEAAGAAAVVVANRDPEVFAMSGDEDPDPTIPTVMIGLDDWEPIVDALDTETVNVTMKDASGPRTDSYRWLVGEDSFAFGGAIRDMWSPTCHGDPGKVTDAEYKCSTDDGGGVHSNSGVPNHAYALLVDGGDFNGTTVTGIGLDKAAHIYYYAMQLFQTPTSDFIDHADALEVTCDLLVDAELEIYELTVEEDATPNILGTMSAADCAQVTNAIAAVELRTEPVQCDFMPLLEQGGPSLCGAGTTTSTVWSETFEDGLIGWEKDSEVVYPGGGSLPWSSDSTPPGGREGTVARGDDNPASGQCTEGAGDFSSRDTIVSPEITMPTTTSPPSSSTTAAT